MPLVKVVNGIKVYVYYDDHLPPHIHAIYNEHEAQMEIRTGRIIAGRLPARHIRMLRSWLLSNTDPLIAIFLSLNQGIE
jgi:hypothetical protein